MFDNIKREQSHNYIYCESIYCIVQWNKGNCHCRGNSKVILYYVYVNTTSKHRKEQELFKTSFWGLQISTMKQNANECLLICCIYIIKKMSDHFYTWIFFFSSLTPIHWKKTHRTDYLHPVILYKHALVP